MKRYTHILLDLDDTLLDFSASQRCAFQKVMSNIHAPSHDELFLKFREINQDLWLQHERGFCTKREIFVMRWGRLFMTINIQADPLEANRYFLSELATKPIWLDGAEPFFKALATTYRLVLVTNGDAVTQRMRIKHIGLAEYCEEIVISDEVGFAKPHPHIFEHALRVVGVEEKSSVLMIGDNAHADIEGAASFGIDACWFNPRGLPWQGSAAPTFEARNHAEIYAWLGDARKSSQV